MVKREAQMLDYSDLGDEDNSKEFAKKPPARAHRINYNLFDGSYVIDIGLLDESGKETPTGDIYDFTNDRPLPDLEAIRPALQHVLSLSQNAVLVIEFTSEQTYHPGDRFTPESGSDEREITDVYVLAGGRKVAEIPDNMQNVIYSYFGNQIDQADVEARHSREDDEMERWERRRFDESAVKDIASLITEDPDIFSR